MCAQCSELSSNTSTMVRPVIKSLTQSVHQGSNRPSAYYSRTPLSFQIFNIAFESHLLYPSVLSFFLSFFLILI